MTTHAERFRQLFRGYEMRYGRYDIETQEDSGKYTGRARTIDAAIAPEDYKAHLDQKYGIGVIPLCADDRVHFAAIDVDVYDVDHIGIAKRLVDLPVVLTRSKSNGLHIWLFSERGVPATTAVDFMKNLAGELGFGGCEIFPKQTTRVNNVDTGNWINLPFFGDSRKAVLLEKSERGELTEAEGTLDQFLAVAEVCAGHVTSEWLANFGRNLKTGGKSKTAAADFIDGPPCLRRLLIGDPKAAQKLDEARIKGEITDDEYREKVKPLLPQIAGNRNTTFYNAATYLQRKYGDDKDLIVDKLNAINVKNGLDFPLREIQTCVTSVIKKPVGYQCNIAPLTDFCQRTKCKRCAFGIGSRSADLPVEVSGLTKIDLEDPIWAINIDGKRVYLDSKDLLDQRRWAVFVLNAATKVWPTMQDAKFKDLVQSWLQHCDTIDGPPDADPVSMLRVALRKYIDEKGYSGKGMTPVANGKVKLAAEGQEAKFLIDGFMAFLRRTEIRMDQTKVTLYLKHHIGATTYKTTVDGKSRSVYVIYIPDLDDDPSNSENDDD